MSVARLASSSCGVSPLSYGFDLSDAELEEFRSVGDGTLASYARLDQLPTPTLPVKYPRDAGWAPGEQENPFNAWA